MAKLKFHQLSEAYTGNFVNYIVLNNPQKKEKYDKFGVRESEQN